MEGLLRRVKHMELRVRYIQHLHRKRRLCLAHWSGVLNPADGLTKSCKVLEMWVNLCAAVGVVPGLSSEGVAWLQSLTLSSDAFCDHAVREGECGHRAGGV